MAATVHDHERGYRMRAFAGRTGMYVQRHGNWDRPLRVWLYRGAWRVICLPCMTSVGSGDELYVNGWPTQQAAFTAALEHCGTCTEVR